VAGHSKGRATVSAKGKSRKKKRGRREKSADWEGKLWGESLQDSQRWGKHGKAWGGREIQTPGGKQWGKRFCEKRWNDVSQIKLFDRREAKREGTANTINPENLRRKAGMWLPLESIVL